MNIVVLDGYTLNPGDLSWDAFHQLGNCTVYDRTAPGEVLCRACGAEVLITNKTVLSADLMAALPKLRYIGVLATGYNVVDVAAACAHGVTVTNVPGYSTRSVAQHAMALLLELSNHVEGFFLLGPTVARTGRFDDGNRGVWDHWPMRGRTRAGFRDEGAREFPQEV